MAASQSRSAVRACQCNRSMEVSRSGRQHQRGGQRQRGGTVPTNDSQPCVHSGIGQTKRRIVSGSVGGSHTCRSSWNICGQSYRRKGSDQYRSYFKGGVNCKSRGMVLHPSLSRSSVMLVYVKEASTTYPFVEPHCLSIWHTMGP